MNVREATAADRATVFAFTEAIFEENWDRPWPPREVGPQMFEGKLVLLAEDDGEPVGFAFGDVGPYSHAHVNIVYVVPEKRRQGVTRALLAAFGERAREAGLEHLTLDVATRNEVGREVWRRLGFTEWSQRLTVPIARLEQQDAQGESYASIHVQSDDRDAVEAAVGGVERRHDPESTRGPRPRDPSARRAAAGARPRAAARRATSPSERPRAPRRARRRSGARRPSG